MRDLVGDRRLVAALGVIAALAVAGGYAVAVRDRPEPVRIALSDRSPAPEEDHEAQLRVHVAGAVALPGLYRLRQGSRVHDAVAAAGGPSPEADVDALNLAAKLRDGDKVLVPGRAGHPAAGGASSAGSGGAPPTAPAVVNLNTASASELDALPGIGPALAARIIAYRDEHGGFRSVKDLANVPGIGPRKLAELEPRVTV